jgi:hypothetical protein
MNRWVAIPPVRIPIMSIALFLEDPQDEFELKAPY